MLAPSLTEEPSTVSPRDRRHEFEQTQDGQRAKKVRFIFQVGSLVLLSAGGIVLLIGPLVLQWRGSVTFAAFVSCLLLAALSSATGLLYYGSLSRYFTPQADRDRRLEQERAYEALVQDTELPALLKYNRNQMLEYHAIATRQARTAGRNSQVAISVGFLALLVGAVVIITSPDPVTKITTAGLAALGGVFSGYITKTFFDAHQRAEDKLYRYWEQPLSTSYLLAAERIAKGLSSDGQSTRDKELIKLITQVLQLAARPTGASLNGGATASGRGRSRAKQKQDVAEEPRQVTAQAG